MTEDCGSGIDVWGIFSESAVSDGPTSLKLDYV